MLKDEGAILQARRHTIELIEAIASGGGYLYLVCFLEFYLPIAAIVIESWEYCSVA